jgi:hypothetical protein
LQVPEIIRENNFEDWHGLCSYKMSKTERKETMHKPLLEIPEDMIFYRSNYPFGHMPSYRSTDGKKYLFILDGTIMTGKQAFDRISTTWEPRTEPEILWKNLNLGKLTTL